MSNMRGNRDGDSVGHGTHPKVAMTEGEIVAVHMSNEQSARRLTSGTTPLGAKFAVMAMLDVSYPTA